MRKILIILTLIIISIPVFSEVSGIDILEKADKTLFPTNAEFKWTMTVYNSNDRDRTSKFLCWKKGDEKYLFYTISPKSTYGQSSLRIDDTIWMYMPLADETVRTSYRSAFLNSDLSYADIMYNELSQYYDSSILEESEGTVILELRAKPGADGYYRIVTEIDLENYSTLNRKYYSKSGQLLKTIIFSDFEFQGSQLKKMKLEVSQPLLPEQKTVAEFFDIKVKNKISNKNFTLNYIKNFQTTERW